MLHFGLRGEVVLVQQRAGQGACRRRDVSSVQQRRKLLEKAAPERTERQLVRGDELRQRGVQHSLALRRQQRLKVLIGRAVWHSETPTCLLASGRIARESLSLWPWYVGAHDGMTRLARNVRKEAALLAAIAAHETVGLGGVECVHRVAIIILVVLVHVLVHVAIARAPCTRLANKGVHHTHARSRLPCKLPGAAWNNLGDALEQQREYGEVR